MLTSPRMYRLLPLAALLLLSIVPTVTEVVNSISDCAEYFLQNPPRIPGILEGGNILDQNRYKPICQTWNNQRRFVTLYDTDNKIPVFSAYKYRGTNSKRPKNEPWKIEPQLESESGDNNMKYSSKNEIYDKQAGDTDYLRKGYDRGHLFPCSYASTKDDKKSTFTLTNAVPQERKFNQGSWKRMETCIKFVLDKYCHNNNGVIEGFLVTGAKPGTRKMSNKVNVPSMLWSAFCCFSYSESRWLASAHWGQNVQDGSKHLLETKTLAELHQELNSEFEVFPGTQCPLHTTVTQLNPKLCTCPSPSTTIAKSRRRAFEESLRSVKRITKRKRKYIFRSPCRSPLSCGGNRKRGYKYPSHRSASC
ncbi:uncharacterized protein LOC129116530 [Anoplopoma fimbria]|uniref:uncharacterized protein LOC129116530 n=1 Tax=Anoplopoma fimbria TaxID=229290 RepID=UPI0023EDA0D7|nr:uncharacterized protein LOC129116530 [Anoplopoma fimbria]